MSGSVNTKNTEKIHKNALSKNESNQNAMKLLLQKRTYLKAMNVTYEPSRIENTEYNFYG